MDGQLSKSLWVDKNGNLVSRKLRMLRTVLQFLEKVLGLYDEAEFYFYF